MTADLAFEGVAFVKIEAVCIIRTLVKHLQEMADSWMLKFPRPDVSGRRCKCEKSEFYISTN